MLLHEVMKHCRFPRLKYLGCRQFQGGQIPYYKLDWSVFDSMLPIAGMPIFKDEFIYCQFLMQQHHKDKMETDLVDMVSNTIRRKLLRNAPFEETMIAAFVDMVRQLADCAYDLSTNFYYKDHRRKVLHFMLLWWILQENFGSLAIINNGIVKVLYNDLQTSITELKEILDQPSANTTGASIRLFQEDTLDLLQNVVTAFDVYCDRYAINEDEDVEFTD